MRRWLVLDEETDTAWCPAWYPTLQAAKYLNCRPWELIKQSVYWQDKALIAMSAEIQARKILSQH